MSEIAIRAESLGKQFRLAGPREVYYTLRDTLAQAVMSPFRRVRKLLQGQPLSTSGSDQAFWALRDVDFEVKSGDVVGVIGHNGAGKSTLLKVLSRITAPTTGSVDIHGRIGSLLEVGTGFHGELSGRENLYLNGAILGMKRGEIDRKFDEIVAFAGVERFIDTPAKHYSTGMYLRLAFAVAAHLEPEILLVDEVLAVGDASFQKKCIGKMSDVASEGRTILLVSHNMTAIRQLTNTCMLLDQGGLAAYGPTEEVVNRYLSLVSERSNGVYHVEHRPRRYSGLRREVELLTMEFEDPDTRTFPAEAEIPIHLTVRGNVAVESFGFMLTICRWDNTPVGYLFDRPVHRLAQNEIARYRLVLRDLNLAQGKYHCIVQTGEGSPLDSMREFDYVHDVLHFEIMATEVDGVLARWYPSWGAVKFKPPQVERVAT